MALITNHPLLEDRDCIELRSRIWSLRDHWIARGQHEPRDFFTLGVAAYLDVLDSSDAEESYYARLHSSNRLLVAHFADLLERVRRFFTAFFATEVALADELAIPGFHIFLGQAIQRASTAPAHFDMQYEALRFGRPMDDELPFSFTLPIALPPAGGGLTTWPVFDEEWRRAGSAVVDARDGSLTYAYSPGTLLLQYGHVLHRIAPSGALSLDDERITLQGHGIRSGGRWQLYW